MMDCGDRVSGRVVWFEWMFRRLARKLGDKLCGLYRTSLQVVQQMMEDMVMKFADRLVLTEKEQKLVVIDDKESALL